MFILAKYNKNILLSMIFTAQLAFRYIQTTGEGPSGMGATYRYVANGMLESYVSEDLSLPQVSGKR